MKANKTACFAGTVPTCFDYIRELWEYQRAVGVISAASSELLPDSRRLYGLRRLARSWWQTTLDLVADAKSPQDVV